MESLFLRLGRDNNAENSGSWINRCRKNFVVCRIKPDSLTRMESIQINKFIITNQFPGILQLFRKQLHSPSICSTFIMVKPMWCSFIACSKLLVSQAPFTVFCQTKPFNEKLGSVDKLAIPPDIVKRGPR